MLKPLKINKEIQTPYGYLDEDWVKTNLSKLGIMWNEKTGNWVMFTEEKAGKLIAMAYNNLLVAIKQIQQAQDRKDVDEKVMDLALEKGYGNKYLPDVLGFSSYGTLMSNYKIS